MGGQMEGPLKYGAAEQWTRFPSQLKHKDFPFYSTNN